MLVINTLEEAQSAYQSLLANAPLHPEGKSGEVANETVRAIRTFCNEHTIPITAIAPGRNQADVERHFLEATEREYLHDARYCWNSIHISDGLSTRELQQHTRSLDENLRQANNAAAVMGKFRHRLSSIDPESGLDDSAMRSRLHERLTARYLRNAASEIDTFLGATLTSPRADEYWQALRESMDSAALALLNNGQKPLENKNYHALIARLARKLGIAAGKPLPRSLPHVSQVQLLSRGAHDAGHAAGFVRGIRGEDIAGKDEPDLTSPYR